jgi:hypothetical protein
MSAEKSCHLEEIYEVVDTAVSSNCKDPSGMTNKSLKSFVFFVPFVVKKNVII